MSKFNPNGILHSNRNEKIAYKDVTMIGCIKMFNRYYLLDAADQEINFK
jgi:hypothetical protein